jgi:hypothetical protein
MADFYNRRIVIKDYSIREGVCAYLSLISPHAIIDVDCNVIRQRFSLCEGAPRTLNNTQGVHKENDRATPMETANPKKNLADPSKDRHAGIARNNGIQLSRHVNSSSLTDSGLSLFYGVKFIDCASHFSHSFLSCDPKSYCVSRHASQCAIPINGTQTPTWSQPSRVFTPMFRCDLYGDVVPYTLVCDFRRDCSDGSDETRCQHREDGQGFRCSYGQWIDDSKVCDWRDDCLDASDEQLCDNYRTGNIDSFSRPQPPVIIDMDGLGSLTTQAMDPADPTCPDTHFRCPGQHVYCLPVYLRCNGVQDCLGGEDEICDDVTCPGYYRCRSSRVCLHANHLCDGWPQCPERDDELLCNATCPSACHCEGLAFVCHQPFKASRYPDLRYLDTTGSGSAPEDVAGLFYLVYLDLTNCGIKTWPLAVFPNLQELALSNNKISEFNMESVHSLPSLTSLTLRGNPLYILSSAIATQTALTMLDLSHRLLSELNVDWLVSFPSILHLNVSHSGLQKIRGGLAVLPQLSSTYHTAT